jgi:hypothetical protein
MVSRIVVFSIAVLILVAAPSKFEAAEDGFVDQVPSRNVLTTAQWHRVDRSIERGLEYLISRQRPNGSFHTEGTGQPGVTSLCVMCFLANGYLPGEGKYGSQLSKAVEFVCSLQTESGVIASAHPGGPKISRNFEHHVGETVAYNHAISSLMLSEIYGMSGGNNQLVDQSIIQRCLDVSLQMHRWKKPRKSDRGGWRYAQFQNDAESDLSLTGWQVMFLRSAKNAGFDVPAKPIDEATEYVLRCYRPDYGTFNYYIRGKEDRRSRGMAGAGILALAHAGMHNRKEALAAGDWILKHDFRHYNNQLKFKQHRWYNDCYHYGVFYCSQAMYQLGGDYWSRFFPKTSDVLIRNQQQDGSWSLCNSGGRQYGKCYSSSMSILALSAPNQLLPVLHR